MCVRVCVGGGGGGGGGGEGGERRVVVLYLTVGCHHQSDSA